MVSNFTKRQEFDIEDAVSRFHLAYRGDNPTQLFVERLAEDDFASIGRTMFAHRNIDAIPEHHLIWAGYERVINKIT